MHRSSGFIGNSGGDDVRSLSIKAVQSCGFYIQRWNVPVVDSRSHPVKDLVDDLTALWASEAFGSDLFPA